MHVAWLLLFLLAGRGALTAGEFAIFKSTDRGRSWFRSDTGMPPASRVNALGAAGETLLAGTDAGIFISSDEGGHWRAAEGAAASSSRVISLATAGRQAFAGTDGHGLLASRDQGRSWVSVASFPAKKARSLLASGETFYAGTEADGVFVSSDGGQVWKSLARGLPVRAQVFALAMVESQLFAGLYHHGLHALKDDRWEKIGPVAPLALASIGGTLVVGHNPGGLHWSADQGASWTAAVPASLAAFGLAEDTKDLLPQAPVWELASNGDMLLAGASGSIYFSEDQGRSWTPARTGLPEKSPGISFLLAKKFLLAGTHLNKE